MTNETQQTILDALPVSIFFWDFEFNLLYCNEEAVRGSCAPSKEEYQQNFPKYSPEYQLCGTPTTEKMQMLMADARKHGKITFDWVQFTWFGKAVTYNATAIRGVYEGIEGVYIYASDQEIDAVKEDMLKAFEANERMRAMLDTIPINMSFSDRNFKMLYCNQEIVRMLGAPSKQDYMDNFFKYSPEFQPCGERSDLKVTRLMKQALQNNGIELEWMHKDANGDLIPTLATAVPGEYMGEQGFFVHSKDTRNIRDALANSEAKSRFLARMSHEIRTPISVVLGVSEIELQKPDLSPHLNESFVKIYESATMLLNLVNDILDLSKVEAGKMELNEAPYETVGLVGDIVNLQPILRNNKAIDFKLNVCKELPVSLAGDYIRLMQILNNLLSNAFKYTETGTVELTIGCTNQVGGHTNLTVIVCDTGMGMDAMQLQNVYMDYTRFHEGQHPATVGVGLGMAIVLSLVKLMNGEIDITSEVGVGTCVTLSIPQIVSSSEVLGKDRVCDLQKLKLDARAMTSNYKFTSGPMPHGKVLVVDDTETNLYVTKELLAFYSLQVETCDSGNEAIEKIRTGNVYDIIFMDQMMPELSGTETMQIMRNHGYTQPIIVLTADAILGQAEEFIRQGFNDFISKPISTRHLNAILIKYIKDKQPATS